MGHPDCGRDGKGACGVRGFPPMSPAFGGRHEWGTQVVAGKEKELAGFVVSHPCRPPLADAMDGAPRLWWVLNQKIENVLTCPAYSNFVARQRAEAEMVAMTTRAAVRMAVQVRFMASAGTRGGWPIHPGFSLPATELGAPFMASAAGGRHGWVSTALGLADDYLATALSATVTAKSFSPRCCAVQRDSISTVPISPVA